MSGRIIRGYWDCGQCGTKGIDGLKDTCPACGAGKDKHVRYYMKEVEEVSADELAAAGISGEEADGKHKEWICAYCGYLNNFSAPSCVRCGADREESEEGYGGNTEDAAYTAGEDGSLHRTAPEEKASQEPSYETRPVSSELPSSKGGAGSPRSLLKWLVLGAAVLAALLLFWPHTSSEAVTGFEWARSVTVEELQTFAESGWSLPQGARQTDAKREFYGYEQVFDHYETVYETRSRQVVDHYETSYTYTDNGNGTFSETPVSTPVYKTEYYETPVQKSVYRDVPVYKTKYYYDIDRWITLDTYETSGADHEPKWSSAYTLGEDQRDTLRREQYFTIFEKDKKRRTDYEVWKDQEIGDGFYVTKNLLGIEYSRRRQGET